MRAARSRSRTLAGWRLKRARVYVRTVRMRVKVSGPCAKQNIINNKQCARFADLLNCFRGLVRAFVVVVVIIINL